MLVLVYNWCITLTFLTPVSNKMSSILIFEYLQPTQEYYLINYFRSLTFLTSYFSWPDWGLGISHEHEQRHFSQLSLLAYPNCQGPQSSVFARPLATDRSSKRADGRWSRLRTKVRANSCRHDNHHKAGLFAHRLSAARTTRSQHFCEMRSVFGREFMGIFESVSRCLKVVP